MKKAQSRKFIFLCIILCAVTFDLQASEGVRIDKKYHITKPTGKNVDAVVRLTEASGLTLSHAGKSLWTVSDNKENYVFKMSTKGKPKDTESFEITGFPYSRPDLEGICLSGDGKYIYLVQEQDLAIIKILVTSGAVDAVIVPPAVPLSSMKNYSTKVRPYLGGKKNSGLEGITYHTGTNDIFVLVEEVTDNVKSGPLLIQINNGLDTIVESKFIGAENGFVGIDGSREIDGSGIDFDRTSDSHFYIVSDRGQRLFLYDWQTNTAQPEIDLNYPNAEGVAYDPQREMFFIITDGGKKKSKLYSYKKE